MQAIRELYSPTYRASWALVIGVDSYRNLPALRTAEHGARAVARYLRDTLGFTVTELYNDQPSRESILCWFAQLKDHPDDRVLFYFAGHGITHSLKNRSKGFLALAQSDSYWNALAMDDILDEAEALSAKHVLYLLDACFSGMALRGRSGTFDSRRMVEYLLTRPARYAITSGGEEVVDDDAAGEYSLFTHFLLQALTDKTLHVDGMLRAKEVGLYIEENVSAHRRSRALPNHGYLQGSGDGDFLFFWETGPRLPSDLEIALRSNVTEVRGGAVAALIKRVRNSTDLELAHLARERLEMIARTEPDVQVRATAQRWFDEEQAVLHAKRELARQEILDVQMVETRRTKDRTAQIVLEAGDTIQHERFVVEHEEGKKRRLSRPMLLKILALIIAVGIVVGIILLVGR